MWILIRIISAYATVRNSSHGNSNSIQRIYRTFRLVVNKMYASHICLTSKTRQEDMRTHATVTCDGTWVGCEGGKGDVR